MYIPAIVEYVPPQVVRCLASFLDFCYLVRRSEIGEDTLAQIHATLKQFHVAREVFRDAGVRPTGFSLPRQHALTHYPRLIQEFGAPNGLCSSITESRHITAVTRPWRQSNRYEALGQMLLINQRLDKLAAARAEYISRGMLPPDPKTCTTSTPLLDVENENIDAEAIDDTIEGRVVMARHQRKYLSIFLPAGSNLTTTHAHDLTEPRYPRHIKQLADYIAAPQLLALTEQFLQHQLSTPLQVDSSLDDVSRIIGPVSVFHSASANFFAPSDQSGIRGMRREIIRSTPKWRQKYERRDCVLIVEDHERRGMRGMIVGQVKLLFSFTYDGVTYPCALINRFTRVGRAPDSVTGMWKVRPELDRYGNRVQSVEHLDVIFRSAHLIPVFGDGPLPTEFHYRDSLEAFTTYYINKYADHHMFEVVV